MQRVDSNNAIPQKKRDIIDIHASEQNRVKTGQLLVRNLQTRLLLYTDWMNNINL